MSALFNHTVRYEMVAKNPITAVRQSSRREKVPVILEGDELHRLFKELELRERTMIVCDALTDMRRSELMGLQWQDIDFIGCRINIVRSVVDEAIGNCKTEASRKLVVMEEHIAQAFIGGDRRACTPVPTIGCGLRRTREANSLCGFRPSCGTTSSRRRDEPISARKSAGTPSGTHSQPW